MCVHIIYILLYTRYVIIHAVQDFRSRLYMVPKYAWRVQHAASSSFDVIDRLRLRTHIIGTYIRNIMDDRRKDGMEIESTAIQQRFLRHYNTIYVECIYNANTIYPGLAPYTVIAAGTNDDFCVTKSMRTHCCYYILYYYYNTFAFVLGDHTILYTTTTLSPAPVGFSIWERCSAFTRGALSYTFNTLETRRQTAYIPL